MSDRRTILIGGGGTGGHVYPGLALADELARADANIDVVWVGTRGRVEERAVPAAGLPIEFVDVSFIKGRRGVDRLAALARMPKAGVQAFDLLRRHRPVAVIGVGGFASGPIGAAAIATRTPLFLLEQNAAPGMTNRLLARGADTVYATFEDARRHFGSAVVKTMGNPIRRALLDGAARRRLGGRISILVVGGSQGARVLNEKIPGALSSLRAAGVALDVRHAAGRGNAETVEAAYADAGFEGARVDAFIDDMADAYSNADLIIARAGATTVSEVCAVGLPALYVPFAAAADDHQTANARAVVEGGGAVMIAEGELSAARVQRMLQPILQHPAVLDRMAAASKALARPNAGQEIAADILERIA